VWNAGGITWEILRDAHLDLAGVNPLLCDNC
jgi:hypothetical protein